MPWCRAKLSRITIADRARDAEQWHVAAAYYRSALRRNPQNPPIWVQYGHVLKVVGHLPEAEAAYREAIACSPRSADPHLQLGNVLKIQGRRKEAEAAYLRALVLNPMLKAAFSELNQMGWSEAHLSELDEIMSRALPAGVHLSGHLVEHAENLVTDQRLPRGEPRQAI